MSDTRGRRLSAPSTTALMRSFARADTLRCTRSRERVSILILSTVRDPLPCSATV